MRICLVISQLCAGGAEGVMARLANHWAEAGHQITLITVATRAEHDHYSLLPSIRRVGLGLMSASSHPLAGLKKGVCRIRKLRAAIRESAPDTIVSFMAQTNLDTLLATASLGLPVAVCERVDPRCHAIGRPREWLRRALYPRAAAIVVQTEGLRSWASAFGTTVHVAQNALDAPPRVTGPGSSGPTKVDGTRLVLAMGRLHRQKGFDLLIDAFARIAKKHPTWSLGILGDGPERANLEEQISGAGLQDRVRLLGKVVPPWNTLRAADLFVLSSRYEGFPNALLEAMACGLPAIATNCMTGPSDIVRHGVDGILVPAEDVNALAHALGGLMADTRQRERLAVAATDVVTRFAPSRVLASWDAILASLRT